MYENNDIPTITYTHYIAVTFLNNKHPYFFGTDIIDLKAGDYVIVETARGKEIGIIEGELIDITKYSSELSLKPILRRANDVDKRASEQNKKDAKVAMEICEGEVARLNLNMNLLSAEYTLDKAKITISYLADERVDFRELLKSLAARLKTRIELRQIGPRDKAKMVGGIGLCGLPLCCSTFLNEFDGISINRAKNQMLAINIPKLSGHCGKLICCLKFEDEAYTDLKKDFPFIGYKIKVDNKEYAVTGMNLISKNIQLDSEDEKKFLSLEDFRYAEKNHVFPVAKPKLDSFVASIEEKKKPEEEIQNNNQNQNNGEHRNNFNRNHRHHFRNNHNNHR